MTCCTIAVQYAVAVILPRLEVVSDFKDFHWKIMTAIWGANFAGRGIR